MSGISPISMAGGGAYNIYFHPVNSGPINPIKPIPVLPENNKIDTGWAINSFKSVLDFFAKTSEPVGNKPVSINHEIQAQCPACSNREYTCSNGETTDGKTSIIPGHRSVEKVRQHEAEHLKIARMNALTNGKMVVAQHINTITEKCPECGEIYVSKGEAITETVDIITMRAGTYQSSHNQSKGPNLMLEGVGRLFDGYG